MKKSEIFLLLLGDWSADGHGKTATKPVKMEWEDSLHPNLSVEEILASAEQAILSQFGLDLEHFCQEYEENEPTPEQKEILKNLGFVEEAEEDFWWHEDYFSLYQKLVNKVFPDVTISDFKMTKHCLPGGYGLFE